MSNDDTMTKFKNNLTTGNIITIIIWIVTVVWMFAVVQTKVNNNTKRINQILQSMSSYHSYVNRTYVRKDVMNKILKNQQETKKRLVRIENYLLK